MSKAIFCKPSPVEVLAVTAAPLRELSNFLIYGRHPELLNERARRQPFPVLDKVLVSGKDLKELLKAEKRDKNGKLFFDCTDSRNHRGVLIHNFNAQFWVDYFRCGIGLVSVSYFSRLASAEGSVLPLMSRTVVDSYEYQWFTHDLAEKYFQKEKPTIYIKKLAEYFINRVNQNLISPYSIRSEEKQADGSYKFVQGSFDNLKEILKQAYFVCEAIKREKDKGGKCWVSPHLTITCGNLKRLSAVEHSTEAFLNQVGALAIRENVPYTVLGESHFCRLENGFSGWVRKNKYRFYLNLQDELQMATPRVKISARFQLINWLKQQGKEGKWIIKAWKLEENIIDNFERGKIASDNVHVS